MTTLEERVEALEDKVKRLDDPDGGKEFMRILATDVAAGGTLPYWMTDQFHIESVYQDKLKSYNKLSKIERFLFRKLFGNPRRDDGSIIEYNDMKSDDFYG
jgi:hypothetical protein